LAYRADILSFKTAMNRLNAQTKIQAVINALELLDLAPKK